MISIIYIFFSILFGLFSPNNLKVTNNEEIQLQELQEQQEDLKKELENKNSNEFREDVLKDILGK